MFKIAAPAALLSAEKPHHPTRRTDTLSEPECGPRMAFERQAVLFISRLELSQASKKGPALCPARLSPRGSCCIFRPRKPEGELYRGIVRQIGAGISTEDPRRTLFIKYQPNSGGLDRAPHGGEIVSRWISLAFLELIDGAERNIGSSRKFSL